MQSRTLASYKMKVKNETDKKIKIIIKTKYERVSGYKKTLSTLNKVWKQVQCQPFIVGA